jgi:hypothetical protein
VWKKFSMRFLHFLSSISIGDRLRAPNRPPHAFDEGRALKALVDLVRRLSAPGTGRPGQPPRGREAVLEPTEIRSHAGRQDVQGAWIILREGK